MQFLVVITTIALAASASAGVIVERALRYCDKQPYYDDKYTCYPQNGYLLCPISGGVIYQPCGKACFNPADYGCINGQLVPTGTCNGQVYDKNSYVCVNNFLCPKAFPNVCGTACYSLSQYHCENGHLVQN
ncbi:hypothetical protein FN846DRAFT_813651 [Sphaerosporella brunnea]|uniref:Endo-1,3(4)-beta-glucanase 1 carbohydrate binding domain-containing protein n=1 Tax=Sphaerosporella brunnea TaxID=1250544 RepID=A0A5J5EUQ6_9PEZI|nr:hypothetical protein FN846DRAFT_813651 [Sphaerosporella brunnea]